MANQGIKIRPPIGRMANQEVQIDRESAEIRMPWVAGSPGLHASAFLGSTKEKYVLKITRILLDNPVRLHQGTVHDAQSEDGFRERA
jgi:hypothetical protein